MKLALLLSLLISCSSVTKDECNKISVKELAYDMAMTGQPSGDFDEILNECHSHQIQLNQEDFVISYTEAIKNFCTFENGYKFASMGKEYFHTCPSILADEFTTGYKDGLALFKAQGAQASDQDYTNNEDRKEIRQTTSRLKPYYSGKTIKQCDVSNTCTLKDHCLNTKCQLTGKECAFDYQCMIKGKCLNNQCRYSN